MQSEAVVLLSGGIDSAACAHLIRGEVGTIKGMFFDYGQAAVEPELQAARALSLALGISLVEITLTSGAEFGTGELIGRNAFLLLSAIFLGRFHRGLIAIGIHSGTPYYDCSPGFLARMKHLAEEHTDGQLSIVAPLLQWSKSEIVEYFRSTGLPLASTYSCEAGTLPPCGSCSSCIDRKVLGCYTPSLRG